MGRAYDIPDEWKPAVEYHDFLPHHSPSDVELDDSKQNITAAENVQTEMRGIPEKDRRAAAAEFFAKISAKVPRAYKDPWLTNALRDGIETTLGLRPLPSELEEQGGNNGNTD